MNSFTSARLALSEMISEVMPNIPVYPTWPNNISTPCIIVSLRSGTQSTKRYWESFYQITIVGPAGDNVSAIEAIEEMLETVALALSDNLVQGINWESPGQMTVSGTTYLAVTFEVPMEIDFTGVENAQN